MRIFGDAFTNCTDFESGESRRIRVLYIANDSASLACRRNVIGERKQYPNQGVVLLLASAKVAPPRRGMSQTQGRLTWSLLSFPGT